MHPPALKPRLTLALALVAFTAAAATIASWLSGIQVRGLLQPLEVVAIFALLAWLRPAFRYCFSSLALYVAFSTAFIVLLYALGTSSWPLADWGLAAFDRVLGIDANRIAGATSAIPALELVMCLIYFTAIPQTIFIIVWLGFRHDARLSLFLNRYMICGLVTAACFYFVPAIGAAGTETAAWNAGALRELLALRSGELTTCNCAECHGIVTFPSFHAIWAILLMVTIPSWPMIVLNTLMIISTVTTGGHYVIDVLGGALVCAFVVPMTARQFAASKATAPIRALEIEQMAGA